VLGGAGGAGQTLGGSNTSDPLPICGVRGSGGPHRTVNIFFGERLKKLLYVRAPTAWRRHFDTLAAVLGFASGNPMLSRCHIIKFLICETNKKETCKSRAAERERIK